MTGAGKRILIVEDQRLIAADIENTLKKLGYQVAGSAASGEDAVREATGTRPDLVLMDVRLRGAMDGIQAADAIRTRADVPIVYLTAHADEETIRRASMTSPYGYLVKPFNDWELRAAVEVAISRHETECLLVEERARRRAAEEFKLFVEGVEDYAIFMLDAAGRVASWNEGARRISGYTGDEIRGRDFSILYPQEAADPGVAGAALEAALREGRAESEGWCVRKDGDIFWANVVITAIRDEAGQLHGFGEIARDLTERRRNETALKQTEKELREAVEARDNFLAIASHELRTPLAALVLQLAGLQEMLHHAPVSIGNLDRKLAGKVDKAVKNTDRLTRLVESLLDVSRIVAGQLQLNLEEIDLAELARDVCERLSDEARAAGCLLRMNLAPGVRGVWDRLRMEQVLANLLSNAIKYGRGAPIDVGLEVDGEAVRLSVRDHGIGISPADVTRIFARFERASPVRHYGGLGLGLYITRQIVEAHGGRIGVVSAPGSGSTFRIEIPRGPATPPPSSGIQRREST